MRFLSVEEFDDVVRVDPSEIPSAATAQYDEAEAAQDVSGSIEATTDALAVANTLTLVESTVADVTLTDGEQEVVKAAVEGLLVSIGKRRGTHASVEGIGQTVKDIIAKVIAFFKRMIEKIKGWFASSEKKLEQLKESKEQLIARCKKIKESAGGKTPEVPEDQKLFLIPTSYIPFLFVSKENDPEHAEPAVKFNGLILEARALEIDEEVDLSEAKELAKKETKMIVDCLKKFSNTESKFNLNEMASVVEDFGISGTFRLSVGSKCFAVDFDLSGVLDKIEDMSESESYKAATHAFNTYKFRFIDPKIPDSFKNAELKFKIFDFDKFENAYTQLGKLIGDIEKANKDLVEISSIVEAGIKELESIKPEGIEGSKLVLFNALSSLFVRLLGAISQISTIGGGGAMKVFDLAYHILAKSADVYEHALKGASDKK
jgi:hypothetical protein